MDHPINELFDLKYIINIDNFERIQEAISKATSTAILMVDYTGKPISKHNGLTPFCKLVRSIPELSQQCELCDSVAGLQATRNNKPFIYRCHMNLIDFAVPIIIANQYCGAVMCGQFTLEDSENSVSLPQLFSTDWRQLADFQQSALEELTDTIPTITIEQLNHVTEMINYIVKYIVAEAYTKIKMNEEFIVRSTENKSISLNSFCTLPIQNVIGNVEDNTINILLRPAINYINLHYTEAIKIDQMAALCNISTSYFSRLFNSSMNMTFSDYINQLRIRMAQELLITTDKTIHTIALETGFSGSGYFIKLFKRHKGLTPNQFRDRGVR